MKRETKIPLLSKVAYGMGDVGCNFSWMFVGNFLMIFYTDVFGIGMGAVATLMLVSRLWDAINDPVIGALSDRMGLRGFKIGFGILGGAYLIGALAMLSALLFTFKRDRITNC